jgi:sugar phosphate isomerase/epimerase
MNKFMQSRRQLVKTAGVAAAASFIPQSLSSTIVNSEKANFRFCINTSTISGQKPGVLKYIDIAAKAGYDGIELWVRDVVEYLNQGNSISSLKKQLSDNRLTVENAIGFATWLVDDDDQRNAAFAQMKEEMGIMAQIGCKRIAACPKGLIAGNPLDLFKSGERYKQMIELGRQTGVMPQLEFWGHSQTLFHIGQAMMIAAIANDPEVHILADVYHIFRGDSGFESLKMLNGNVIEIFHMNDYVTSIPREQQADKDRVYPGNGSAPMKQILTDLSNMGGTKVLSIELFNPEYWQQDPSLVAKTGLEKMKKLVELIS